MPVIARSPEGWKMLMPDIKRIGIITSGGDCGGLNAVIKGIAQEAYSSGIESVVIPNGYAGLYNLIDLNELVLLTPARISLIRGICCRV